MACLHGTRRAFQPFQRPDLPDRLGIVNLVQGASEPGQELGDLIHRQRRRTLARSLTPPPYVLAHTFDYPPDHRQSVPVHRLNSLVHKDISSCQRLSGHNLLARRYAGCPLLGARLVPNL